MEQTFLCFTTMNFLALAFCYVVPDLNTAEVGGRVPEMEAWSVGLKQRALHP